MIPTVNKMEDLSGLEPKTPALIISLAFLQADKNIDRKIALHRRQIVRLIDKALIEYNQARKMIALQIQSEGEQIYIFSFINYMENCISTLRRTLRYIDSLKRNENHLHIPRELRKTIESLSPDLINIRNDIEHLDERIQKSELVNGEPIMLKHTDSGDGITLCANTIKFNQISALLKKLHVVADMLALWNRQTSE